MTPGHAPVVFSTGTDEHGAKVFDAARAAHVPCQAYCDAISGQFRHALDAMHISYDVFVRTTDARHVRTAQALWRRLWARGFIRRGHHRGWYCKSDEAFLTLQQTEERGGERVSKESGHAVELVDEPNFLFALPQWKQGLQRWLGNGPAVQPRGRVREVEAWVEGLQDLSVSRPSARVRWGIDVGEEQRMYVWLDALANYVTASGVDPEVLEKEPEVQWARAVHVIGKDILRFHAVYWPAFLMAAGMPLPEKVVAHGHWTVGGVKMSKSLGNVVDPMQLREEFGTDPVRYFLLASSSLENDSDFDKEALAMSFNDQVVNVLGNLLSRSSSNKILIRPLQKIPIEHLKYTDSSVVESLNALQEQVDSDMQSFAFGAAIKKVANAMRDVNVYFSEHEPWKLAKDAEAQGERLDEVCYITLSAVRIAALMLLPVIPGKRIR